MIKNLIIAQGMGIEHALLFVKALFLEYNDRDLEIRIKEDTPELCEVAEGE
jgi:hypothetical protein